MTKELINAIVANVTISNENVVALLNCLHEKKQETALEILLGIHKYQNVAIPYSVVPEDTDNRHYTAPHKLISVDLLEGTVQYREKYDYWDIKYFLNMEDAEANRDYVAYARDSHPLKVKGEETRHDWNNRSMSIDEWMKILDKKHGR